MNIISWILANSNTSDVLEGMGSIKGKNATISSITAINGGNKITFAYTLDDGTQQTSTLDVLDAYGIALKNGFVGTEEEWLESLKADDVTVETLVEEKVQEQIETQLDTTIQDKVDQAIEEALGGGGSSEIEDEIDSWF